MIKSQHHLMPIGKMIIYVTTLALFINIASTTTSNTPITTAWITTPTYTGGNFSQCSLQELGDKRGRYLKEVCYNNNTPWYKCPHSDNYYNVTNSQGDDCYGIGFNKLCPSDPVYYQACGHGGCPNTAATSTRHGVCSTYVCQSSDLWDWYLAGSFLTTALHCNGVQGKSVHFYGNSGVCVFKYLVTQDDPQKWYSVAVLITNFICFIVISISYIIIHMKTVSSSKSLLNEQLRLRNRKLQAKVTAIIITDFLCWLPFTTICFLHFGEVIDATSWYPIFSSIILPINSVINPILYDNLLADTVFRPFGMFYRLMRSTMAALSRLHSSLVSSVAQRSNIVETQRRNVETDGPDDTGIEMDTLAPQEARIENHDVTTL